MRGSDPAASLSSSTTRPQDLTRSPAARSGPAGAELAHVAAVRTTSGAPDVDQLHPEEKPENGPGRPSHPPGTTQTTRKREKRQHAATWPQNRPTLASLRPGIQPKCTQGRPGHPQGQGRALHRADIELQDLPAADPRIFGRIRAKTRPTDALCWTFSPPDDHQHPGNGTPARPPPASRRPWTARIHATATAAELRDAAPRVRGSSPGRPGSGNRHPRKRDSGYSRRDRLQREYSTQRLLSLDPPRVPRSAAIGSGQQHRSLRHVRSC